MKHNVGSVDRAIRIIFGMALLVFFFLGEGSMRWVGLIAIIPLATAVLGTCPLYSILGISTCAVKQSA